MDKKLSQDIILHIEKEFKNTKFNCAIFFKNIKTKYRAMDVALICNYILENKKRAFCIRKKDSPNKPLYLLKKGKFLAII